MKVLSVNVSGIRKVDDGGRTVRTGIFKAPTSGPVRVGRLNLDGDDQADRKHHGGEHKAVYAFGQQHLAYWHEALSDETAESLEGMPAGCLGREGIGPGFFGENLSVDVLDETALRVGDRLCAGTALLEITQPRVPCFKLGLRTGIRSMPRAFVRHGLTGAYLRVLETGEVAAGDAVVLEERGKMAYTLAELFAAVYERDGEERPEVLEAALAAEALSEEWRGVVEGRRRRLGR